jgi:heme/copper-type cytochrome/quinol oxidase subunit 3
MRILRPVGDISTLPKMVFGPRDITWWGTLGFIVIEGFTLVLCATSYIYLGKNFDEWPPFGTPLPELVVPTIHVLSMLASIPLMVWISRASRKFELERVRLGLTIATLVCGLFVTLRLVELLDSVNVRWDTNAYGSAQWLLLGAHGTLLAIQLVEVGGVAGIFWLAPLERKHFADADDVAFYWYFMVAAWIPLYVLSFLAPHWL